MQDVALAYEDLLAQTFEYLRPDKLNPNQVLAGIGLDGSLIVVKDPYPLCEVALERIIARFNDNGDQSSLDRLTKEEYEKIGYGEVETFDQATAINAASSLFLNNIVDMSKFCNEFTVDMLPQNSFYSLGFSQFPDGDCEIGDLLQSLRSRRRTLPANGAIVTYENMGAIQEVKLKEIFDEDRIYLIYKVITSRGEFSGYFDTRNQAFYDVFIESSQPKISGQIKKIVLWSYCSAVCSASTYSLQRFQEVFKGPSKSRPALIHIRLDKSQASVSTTSPRTMTRKGNDRYQKELFALNGMIRKLPEGKKPSDEARAYAKEMGLELEEDETYVKPFVRIGYRLSTTDRQDNQQGKSREK